MLTHYSKSTLMFRQEIPEFQRSMRRISIANFKAKTKENKQMIKHLMDGLGALRIQLERMNLKVDQTKADVTDIKHDIEDLRHTNEDLDQRKADKIYVDTELMEKASKNELFDVIRRPEFEESNELLQKMISSVVEKVTLSNEELNNLINQLAEQLEHKVNQDELEEMQIWIKKRLKQLGARIAALRKAQNDEAAGLRRGLMHFHCISCDRPVNLPPGQEPNPLVDFRNFPMNKSLRPYTTYALSSIRKLYDPSSLHGYDTNGSPRLAGHNPAGSLSYQQNAHLRSTQNNNAPMGENRQGRGKLDNIFSDDSDDGNDQDKLPPIAKNMRDNPAYVGLRTTAAPRNVRNSTPQAYSQASLSKSGRQVHMVRPHTQSSEGVHPTGNGYSVSRIPNVSEATDDPSISQHPPSPEIKSTGFKSLETSQTVSEPQTAREVVEEFGSEPPSVEHSFREH